MRFMSRIDFACPHCGAPARADASLSGQLVACTACAELVRVPASVLVAPPSTDVIPPPVISNSIVAPPVIAPPTVVRSGDKCDSQPAHADHNSGPPASATSPLLVPPPVSETVQAPPVVVPPPKIEAIDSPPTVNVPPIVSAGPPAAPPTPTNMGAKPDAAVAAGLRVPSAPALSPRTRSLAVALMCIAILVIALVLLLRLTSAK